MFDDWAQTQPDIKIVDNDTEVLEAIPDGKHRRVSQVSRGAIGLIFGMAIGGVVSTAAYLTAPKSYDTPNAVTTVMPTVTVTRSGHTVRLPGPTVIRDLRATVTVRTTRTLPRRTVTVTATPTGLTTTGTP